MQPHAGWGRGLSTSCPLAKNRGAKGVLVNAPFMRWTKVSSVVGGHATLQYRRDCLAVAEEVKPTQENSKWTIAGQFNKEMVDWATQNRVIMEHITRTILFLGKQCLALRGKGEDPKRGSNPENFLSLLKLMAENDPTLRRHLKAPLKKNAMHLKCITCSLNRLKEHRTWGSNLW